MTTRVTSICCDTISLPSFTKSATEVVIESDNDLHVKKGCVVDGAVTFNGAVEFVGAVTLPVEPSFTMPMDQLSDVDLTGKAQGNTLICGAGPGYEWVPGAPNHTTLVDLNSGTTLDGGHTALVNVIEDTTAPGTSEGAKVGTLYLDTTASPAQAFICSDSTLTSQVWPRIAMRDQALTVPKIDADTTGHSLTIGAEASTTSIIVGESVSGTSISMFPSDVASAPTSVGVEADGKLTKIVSSRRYKKNISLLTQPEVDMSDKIKFVSFEYIGAKSPVRQWGVIAEDVAPINQSVVQYKDGRPEAVNYNSIFALVIGGLVSRVQKLEAQVNLLQSKVR